VLFPGQGSQVRDMGRDLAESDPQYMDLWKQAERISGLNLREIYWGGTDQDMAETRPLQPAMTVVTLSLWMHAGQKIKPAYLAGHSLGEFPALAASGVLSIEQTLETVCLRGKLMAEAGSGDEGMSAILKLPLAQVEDIVAQAKDETNAVLYIANYNSPGQFAVGGKEKALDAAGVLAKEAKGRAIRLAVSGAFHGPLMQEAAAELSTLMAKLDWHTPKIPVHFNATANTETDPKKIQAIMAKQMTSSVRWIEIIQAQWQENVRKWFEFGPKGVLTKLLKANLADKDEPWEGIGVADLEQAGEL
ncbi:MAG: ACP S-malonyltransferase, partial [Thermodesulfobacteriota bacterium]|nr:ACP S-malonyltransferase [Thermodesulfobacteriota bacterium]